MIHALILLALASAPIQLHGEERVGSRLHWLEDPLAFIRENAEGKAHLEACVAQLGLVRDLRITLEDDRSKIEIDVTNVTPFTLRGMIVQARDEGLAAAGLGGRVEITFPAIPPAGSGSYREVVDAIPATLGDRTRVPVVAWDIIAEDGTQVVRDIFWSHWPTIRSEAELKRAERVLCRP